MVARSPSILVGACLFGTAAAYSASLPHVPRASVASSATRSAVRIFMDEGKGGELSANIDPEDMDKLRMRIQKIQETGLATKSQKLFEMAMSKPPQMLMQEFFRSAPLTIDLLCSSFQRWSATVLTFVVFVLVRALARSLLYPRSQPVIKWSFKPCRTLSQLCWATCHRTSSTRR